VDRHRIADRVERPSSPRQSGPIRLGRLLDRLNALSEIQSVVAGLVLLVTVGALDVLTGYQLALSVFYLVPIVVVSWNAGQRAGLLIALLGGLVWLGADLVGGPRSAHLLLPYWNAAVRTTVFAFVVLTLTSFRWERIVGRTDPLTGLGNRMALFESARSEIERCRRYGRAVSLVYIDCDDFKHVNDSRGHAAGDELLCVVANALRESVRGSDLPARLGGDEFAVLLPETTPDDARAAAEKIRSVLDVAAREGVWGVTFSLGCASFTRAPASVDELIRSADDLMYQAKDAGKNTLRAAVQA
jgi:diguanylate cyclase (GGDEF)-like protein